MRLKVRNVQGEIVDDVTVRDDVFDVPMNEALVHQVVVGQLANARQGTVATKNRSKVSGGGAKIRPQKGTGRARMGSTRAPQWRGGGVVFGPSPRSYRHRTPKRMRRSSLLVSLSDKTREERLVVVDQLLLDPPSTREMAKCLDALGAGAPVLLVGDGTASDVLRAARNIPRVKMLPANLLNTIDIMKHRTVVMTLDAVRKAEEMWGGPFVRRKPNDTSPAPEQET